MPPNPDSAKLAPIIINGFTWKEWIPADLVPTHSIRNKQPIQYSEREIERIHTIQTRIDAGEPVPDPLPAQGATYWQVKSHGRLYGSTGV